VAKHSTPERRRALASVRVYKAELFALDLLKPLRKIAFRVPGVEGFGEVVRNIIAQIGVSPRRPLRVCL